MFGLQDFVLSILSGIIRDIVMGWWSDKIMGSIEVSLTSLRSDWDKNKNSQFLSIFDARVKRKCSLSPGDLEFSRRHVARDLGVVV